MMWARALILSLLLPACSTSEAVPPAAVDPKLYPLYSEFYVRLALANVPTRAQIRSMYYVDSLEDMGAAVEEGVPLSPTVEDSRYFTAGVCTIMESLAEPALDKVLGVRGPHLYTIRVIRISRKTSPERLKAIVFHELAHCTLDLCHSRDPDDLMYPVPPEYSDEAFENMLKVYSTGGTYDDCD